MKTTKLRHFRIGLRPLVWTGSLLLVAGAAAAHGALLTAALQRLEIPFGSLGALVAAGLLADRVGLFRRLARVGAPESFPRPVAVLSLLALTALTSGLINLDVAVVAMVPLGLVAARRRRLPAQRLVVSIALTANAGSILLPTSNVTNLLVLERAPEPWSAFVGQSWAPWLAVTALTVLTLTWFATRVEGSVPEREAVAGSRAAVLVDLVPMYLAASAIEALLGNALVVAGGFPRQLLLAAALAAVTNNLPAAAALHPLGAAGRWADLLGMSMGPNLLATGSLAALIALGLSGGRGRGFGLGMYSLVGGLLLPFQLAVAGACLLGTGALR